MRPATGRRATRHSGTLAYPSRRLFGRAHTSAATARAAETRPRAEARRSSRRSAVAHGAPLRRSDEGFAGGPGATAGSSVAPVSQMDPSGIGGVSLDFGHRKDLAYHLVPRALTCHP